MKFKSFQKYHVQQTNQLDAGIVCLKAILNLNGIVIPLERIRQLSNHSLKGPTLIGLVEASRALGVSCKGYKASIDFLKNNKTPSILYITTNQNKPHYVVCYGYDVENSAYWIGNPENDKLSKYSESDLNESWLSNYLITFDIEATTHNLGNKNIWIQKEFKMFVHNNKKSFVIFAVLSLIIVVYIIGLPIIYQQLLNDVFTHKFIRFQPYDLFWKSLLLSLMVGLNYLRNFIQLRLNRSFSIYLHRQFLFYTAKLPSSYFDHKHFEVFNRPFRLLIQIQGKVLNLIGALVFSGILVVVCLLAMTLYNWILGLLTLGSTFFFAYYSYYFAKKVNKEGIKVLEKKNEVELRYNDFLQNLDDLTSDSALKRTNEHFYRLYQDRMFDLELTKKLYDLKINTQLAFSIGVVLFAATKIEQLPGSLIDITFTTILLFWGLRKFYKHLKLVFELRTITKTLDEYDLLGQEKKDVEYWDNFDNQGFELVLNDVSFSHNKKEELLEKFNLTVRKGELIGIIGKNNCGKSTLIQLIQNKYPVKSGQITINGIDVNMIHPNYLKTKIEVISQKNSFFDGSLIENILMEDSVSKRIELESFLVDNGFDLYFKKFPNGYETRLGKHKECISAASQKLILIARALWKRPQLLILDDTFAPLDHELRQFIIQVLKNNAPEIGIIVTSTQAFIREFTNRTYFLQEGKVGLVK